MNREDFYAACRQAIAKVKRISPESVNIAGSETFSMYGLDSLDVMNFLLELEQGCGTTMEEVDPAQCNTVDLLWEYVQGR